MGICLVAKNHISHIAALHFILKKSYHSFSFYRLPALTQIIKYAFRSLLSLKIDNEGKNKKRLKNSFYLRKVSCEVLFMNRTEMQRGKSVIGKDTVNCIY